MFRSTQPARPAFTLIEVIVAIGIVVIVLALTTVGIRHARSTAVAAKCLVNARTCATALFADTNDYEEQFPYFAEHRRLERAFFNGPYNIDYFSQSHHWPLVARQYLSDDRLLAEAICPGQTNVLSDRQASLAEYPDGYVVPSGYATAFGTFSDPAYWTEGPARQTPKPPEWVFRPVRVSETLFPADKGFLIERVSNHSIIGAVAEQQVNLILNRPQAARLTFSTITIDGAGAMRRPIDLQAGFRGGTPVLNTTDGIRGGASTRDLIPLFTLSA